jgi:hypothetical protein
VRTVVASVEDPDPGSGAFLTGSGMGKISRSGSGMNIPDHICVGLETMFWVKILELFDAYPDSGSGIVLTWIRDGKIRIRDPG